MDKILNYYKNYFKTRSVGFYFTISCWVILLLETIIYPIVPIDIFGVSVVIVLVVGVVASLAALAHDLTARLSPVIIMVCTFLSLVLIAKTNGFIDYFSTQFFSGVTLEVILGLPFPVLFTISAIVLNFILSSVAIYLPQERKNSALKNGGEYYEKTN